MGKAQNPPAVVGDPTRQSRAALLRRNSSEFPPVRKLALRNHQRGCPVSLPVLRRIVCSLLESLEDYRLYELDVHLVGVAEITRLNETFLGHQGATDVLAFAYPAPSQAPIRGEIFVCLPVALSQARRFRTTWQRELVRYVVHAVLHLCGFHDHRAAQRRKMKRAEDAFLRHLAARHDFAKLGGSPDIRS